MSKAAKNEAQIVQKRINHQRLGAERVDNLPSKIRKHLEECLEKEDQSSFLGPKWGRFYQWGPSYSKCVEDGKAMCKKKSCKNTVEEIAKSADYLRKTEQ